MNIRSLGVRRLGLLAERKLDDYDKKKMDNPCQLSQFTASSLSFAPNFEEDAPNSEPNQLILGTSIVHTSEHS